MFESLLIWLIFPLICLSTCALCYSADLLAVWQKLLPNTTVHVTDLVSRLLDWMFDLTVASIIFHNEFCEWVCNVACDVRFHYFAYFPNPLRILRTSRKCSKNIFYVLKRSRMRKKYEIRNESVQNDFTDRLSRLRPLRSTEYLSITAY